MTKYNYLLLLFIFFTKFTIAQVNSSFSMSNSAGCSPIAVNFTDESTGGVTSWSWNFGNGNTSTQQNPGAVYTSPGRYGVCLTVDDGLNTDTFCDTVVVYNDPQIDFIADETSGCANHTVNFTNLTITETGIETVFWSFGNGNSSNSINPSQTFAEGDYDITLVVTDSAGCMSQGERLQYINVLPPPVANFTGMNNQNCAIPSLVNFNNTSTNALGATYTWDFGDGSPVSNLENPTYSYTNPGSYNAQLIIDVNGCIDSITRQNFVVLQMQDADFTTSTTTACIGESIDFTDQSALTSTAWSWDFGDGSMPSTQQNPSHTYNTAGVYTVSLSTFLTGCDDIETKTNIITILDGPMVNFDASGMDTCQAPFLVNFTSMSSPGVNYNWDFGDGNMSTAANPSNTYLNTGSYNVSLTVTNANNCTSNLTMSNFININPPMASFQADSIQGCVPYVNTFVDMSTSDSPIADWFWDFGDGNTLNGVQNPMHTYMDTGSFQISLAITTIDGCVDTFTSNTFTNVGMEFQPDFTATPLSGCKTDPVNFTNLTDTLGISTDRLNWRWEFGDGGMDIVFEPQYEYGDTGTFDVRLFVTHNGCTRMIEYENLITINPPIALFEIEVACEDYEEFSFIDNSTGPQIWTWDIAGDTFNTQDVMNYDVSALNSPIPVTLYVENTTFGCIDSLSANVPINIPVVDFASDNTSGCVPFNVQFTNNSTFGVSYEWDFGDGSPISTMVNPSHTYNTPGIYSVRLIVENSVGENCSDTLLLQNYITVLGNSPSFNSPDTAGCRNFTTSFVDMTQELMGQITNWSWDFGDGSPSNTNQNPTHTFQSVGSFDISLTTTDINGCVNTTSRLEYITATGPLPSFNNMNISCVNTDVLFNNTSSSLGGNITNYLWDLGDGNNSILENPTHQYSNQGQFDISLFIQDDNGCDSTLVVQNAITIDSLTVEFTADSTVGSCAGFIVNYEELVSPSPTSWTWDFGNGSTSSSPNPTTVYNNVGSFDVTLIATNASGCIDTIVKPDYIVVNGPVGVLSTSTNSGCIDLEVEFDIASLNSELQIWDFGDGTVISNTNTSFTYTYTESSIYFPLVILQDSAGCSIAYEFDSINVGSLNPIIAVDTNYICSPNSVNFMDLSNSTPAITSWSWDFGDGNTSNLQSPSNNYTQGGVFDISLTVDNGVCSETTTLTEYLVSDASTNALFDLIITDLACPLADMQLVNLSTADSAIISYNWDFGDGQVSTVANPGNISYDNSGVYVITLDIETERGCLSSFTDSITINEIPEFTFETDTIDICINEDSAITSLNPDFEYTWSPASNLSCSDCPNPIISGIENTAYMVTALSEFGCVYSDTLQLIVRPLPNITLNPDQKVSEGSTVNLGVFAPGFTSYNWSPVENLSCLDCPNPTFVATQTTQFVVDLTDRFGCNNSDSTLVEVFEICDGSFLLFPNVFTPNNDGQNDVFKPTRRQNLNTEINYFRIFDRWGNLIFETLDLQEGWDGNSKNGTFMNNGVYVYTVDIVCPDGSTLLHKGNITLIR